MSEVTANELHLVDIIDKYYDVLTQYAFLDTQHERDNNPFLIEIKNRIMSNDFNPHQHITTVYNGIITPYEYVCKMKDMLLPLNYDKYQTIPELETTLDSESDSEWITIDDVEYNKCRSEELHYIHEYYNTLIELFTSV